MKLIADIEGFSIPFSAPTFNEFVMRGPKPATEVLERLRSVRLKIGAQLSNFSFVSPTNISKLENRTRIIIARDRQRTICSAQRHCFVLELIDLLLQFSVLDLD